MKQRFRLATVCLNAVYNYLTELFWLATLKDRPHSENRFNRKPGRGGCRRPYGGRAGERLPAVGIRSARGLRVSVNGRGRARKIPLPNMHRSAHILSPTVISDPKLTLDFDCHHALLFADSKYRRAARYRT